LILPQGAVLKRRDFQNKRKVSNGFDAFYYIGKHIYRKYLLKVILDKKIERQKDYQIWRGSKAN
jgi:hypothetical protein